MRITSAALSYFILINNNNGSVDAFTRSIGVSFTSSPSVRKVMNQKDLNLHSIPTNEDYDDDDDANVPVSSSTMSRRKKARKALATLTVAASTFLLTSQPVLAKVPFGWTGETITESVVKDAQNKEFYVRENAEKAHQADLAQITKEKGALVARKYNEQYRNRLRVIEAKKSLITTRLKRDLIQRGVAPNGIEYNGYLFESMYGLNMFEIPGTDYQNEMNRISNLSEEELRQERQTNIETYKEDLDEAIEIADISERSLRQLSTMFNMQDLVADVLDVVEESTHDDAVSSNAAMIKQASKAERKAEKEKHKAEMKALKEKAKEEKKAAKAEAKRLKAEAKEKVKKEKEAAKAAAEVAAMTKAVSIPSVSSEVEDVISNEASSIDSDDEVSQTSYDNEILEEDTGPSVSSVSTVVDANISDKIQIAKKVGITVVAGIAAAGGYTFYRKKNAEEEEKRMAQYKLIMGVDNESVGGEVETVANIEDDLLASTSVTEVQAETNQIEAAPTPSPPAKEEPENLTESAPKKKQRRKGLASIFSKKDEKARVTDLNELFSPTASCPNFSKALAGVLTFGAPGRFPDVEALPGRPTTFELEEVQKMLSEMREAEGMTTEQGAEAFACVVNCMIITIVDLASSTLKEKDEKITVDALNVVFDFMDNAASLYDACASGAVITPVTYGGTLGNKKLEQMYSKYAGGTLSLMDTNAQDRLDTLQQLFKLSDKKAEGLTQKVMMKNLMKLMKDGGEGGMEGMPGMKEMMESMGGEGGLDALGGLGGLGGMGEGGDISPEDLKQTISMMQELLESGQVSKEELKMIRGEFKKTNGVDLTELIQAAEGMGDEELGNEGKELLDLFKKVLGDE